MAKRTISIELPQEVYQRFAEQARLDLFDDVSLYISKGLSRVANEAKDPPPTIDFTVWLEAETTLVDAVHKVADKTTGVTSASAAVIAASDDLVPRLPASAPQVREPKDLLTDNLRAALDTLSELDDLALQKVVDDDFPTSASQRLETLNLKAQQASLTSEEIEEQAKLLDSHERLMLLRAEAAFLLKSHGHDVPLT